MREILFRGKRHGKWIYGYYNHCKISDIHEIISEEYRCIGVEVEKETIGQFTGLLDKNGKRIFENDVYKDEQEDLFKVVQMDCGRYALELIEDGYIDEFIDWSYVEIIGNIHDNND